MNVCNWMRVGLLVVAQLSIAAQSRLLAAQNVAAVPRWTLTLDARFGSTTDTAATLLSPWVVTVAPNGNTLVFDLRTTQIKVFDQNAKFLRIIGRKGQGPGEYGRVSTMGYLGDTLWISDPDLRRFTLFPPGGGEPRVFDLEYTPPPQFARVMPQLLRSGLAVVQPTLLSNSRTPPPLADIPNPIILMRRDGTIADTLAAISERTRGSMFIMIVNSRGTQTTYGRAQPFRALWYWGARADGRGVALVEPPVQPVRAGAAAFSVTTFDSAGREVRKRSYPYEPVPATDRLRDSIVKAIGAVGGGDATAKVREEMELAPFFPPVTDIRVGRDGSVWLRRELVVDDGRRWSVIDPSGALVGNVVLPDRAVIKYVDMEQVLTSETDATGEAWVVRYRITRNNR